MWLFSQDADEDGISDTEETFGFDMGWNHTAWNPPAFQLDPNRQNVLVEVDGMAGRSPSADELHAVESVFATFPNADLRHPNPSGANGVILYCERSDVDEAVFGWGADYIQRFLERKQVLFAASAPTAMERAARQRIFRYCFCADTIPDKKSGLATLGGQNFMIALGNWLTKSPVNNASKEFRTKAIRGTFMHELGHTLGLTHAGVAVSPQDTLSWKVNCKPNYKSVMNYLWQVPLRKIEAYWRLDYSREVRPSLNYSDLSEQAGFGGSAAEKTLIGDQDHERTGVFCVGDTMTADKEFLRAVNDGGPVDINQDCDATDNAVAKRVHWRRRRPEFMPVQPHVLVGANDMKLVDARIQRGYGAAFGDAEIEETNSSELSVASSLWADCDADGITDAEEIEAGASDVDCNSIPDMCENARMVVRWPTRGLCPAGDGDSIVVEVRADGVCGFDAAEWQRTVRVVRAAGSGESFCFWRSTESGVAPSDTAWASSYDSATGRARVVIRRLSGCGALGLGVLVADASLGVLGPMGVSSFDRDAHSIGSVDEFDKSHWTQGWLNGPPVPEDEQCYDLDQSGTINASDLSLLGGHLGHTIPRALVAPNGGQNFGYGEVSEIRWARGYGDSARVNLYLLRDSQPGFERQLVQNESDDGQITWPVYVTDAPAYDYRIRVAHVAGMQAGTNSAGGDVSDAPFTINAAEGGGCPMVDTWTAYGWLEENSVLGRSLTAEMGLDAYKLRWRPGGSQVIRLRIREDEDERSTIDQVRLIAVDHRQEVRAYAAGERVLLGTPQPAKRVSTASGADITAETTGSGLGYQAAAGETLYVELDAGTSAAGVRPLRSTDGDAPFLFDDGGGKGGVPQLAAKPTNATSIDAQVLTTTGVLVQVPDGMDLWRTVRQHFPRESASEALFDSVRSPSVRLVFLDPHRVRFLGSLREAADTLEATKLVLRSAGHSRLGDVYDAVVSFGNITTTLTRGDTLTLDFADPPTRSERVRDYFLLSRGVYTTNLPANQRPTEAPTLFRVYANRPNPFRDLTFIRVDLPVQCHVALEIFDVTGRRLRKLIDRRCESGTMSVTWDGRDEYGGRARPGVYLARVRAGAQRWELKLVVMQ